MQNSKRWVFVTFCRLQKNLTKRRHKSWTLQSSLFNSQFSTAFTAIQLPSRA